MIFRRKKLLQLCDIRDSLPLSLISTDSKQLKFGFHLLSSLLRFNKYRANTGAQRAKLYHRNKSRKESRRTPFLLPSPKSNLHNNFIEDQVMNNLRTRLVNFRVTDQEFEEIKSACDRNGARCISDFVRSRMLGKIEQKTPAETESDGTPVKLEAAV